MSEGLITALWLTPLIAFILYIWRETSRYRREVRKSRERFYGDAERYGTHPRFRDRP